MMTKKYMGHNLKRGDVYYADLSPVIGSEQGGDRPVLIIQNDIGNHHSPTVIVAAITTKRGKPHLPTHVEIKKCKSDKLRHSIILLEQLRTIDKTRLHSRRKIDTLGKATMRNVNKALKVSLHL